jgi:trimeric autotransporter adhesin
MVLLLLIPAACSDSPTSPEPDPLEVGVWQPLGQGLTGLALTFVEFDGDLVVGGTFRTAGDQPARNIARWDGALWHTLGTGLDAPVPAFVVQGLAVLQGELIASGFFGHDRSRAYRWDGEGWLPLGMLQDGGILSLEGHDGVLYAHGSGVSRWTGSTWEAVEVEVGGESFTAEPPVAVHDGDLVVAAAGAGSLARWDGANWTWMERPQGLFGLAAGDGELYGLGGSNHFRWTGSGWAEFPRFPGSISISSSTVHEGDLFLGVQQGTGSYRVVRWSGSEWIPMSGAMDGRVHVLGSWAGIVLAGGEFVAIDESPIRGVARILPPEGSAQGGSP